MQGLLLVVYIDSQSEKDTAVCKWLIWPVCREALMLIFSEVGVCSLCLDHNASLHGAH